MNKENNSYQRPLEFFEWISTIPRKSHDEQRISDSLVTFAKDRGLDAEQDEALNVLIKKPGTKGRENEAPVMLQAHMDMVFETEDEKEYPYGQPLQLAINGGGDIIYAKGTTLGADDGSGVAIILSVLDADDLSHPPIQAIFTVNEEDGLEGASRMSSEWVKGGRLINIDGEVERSVICGCAGAFRSTLSVPVTRAPAEESTVIHIDISGLHGGHSGLEIDKGYGNAIILMVRLLFDLTQTFSIRLVDIQGGKFMNAIPVFAKADIAVPKAQANEIIGKIKTLGRTISGSLGEGDANFSLSEEIVGPAKEAMDRASTGRILNAILLMPNGVESMSPDIDGLVQTSSNLGIVETNAANVILVSNPRSSSESELESMKEKFRDLAKNAGGKLKIDGEYPSWEYSPESKLRPLYMNIYKELFGSEMEETILHGGLECGVIAKHDPKLDAISIGPEIPNVHTVKEEMSLSSFGRVWETVIRTLERI